MSLIKNLQFQMMKIAESELKYEKHNNRVHGFNNC